MNTNERLAAYCDEFPDLQLAFAKEHLLALLAESSGEAAEAARRLKPGPHHFCEKHRQAPPCTVCDYEDVPVEPRTERVGQPEVREPFYHLAQTEDGCHTCAAGEMWTFEWMEDGEPTQPGESWDDKEFVENLIEYLNDAYEAGHVAARGSSGIASGAAERLVQLEKILNTPELDDFAKGVVLEARHQRARWGDEHDLAKEPEEWYWTVGYLAGKALRSQRDGQMDKFKHHLITGAAIMANWHARIMENGAAPGKEGGR